MTVKEFVSALRSYLEQRESLKKQLQQVCNLKNQISYSDLSSLDMKQSVSSARLQAKVMFLAITMSGNILSFE